MTDPTRWSLREARDALRARDISARELTQAHIAAIEAAAALNLFSCLTPERALAAAERSDARLARGEGGALEGVPLGVKDLFCVEGVVSTACSRILEGFTPSYESGVTERLWRAGASLLGKLNCDEFAMGSSTETGMPGAARNPWRGAGDSRSRSAGGSSGGSAAAVAAGLMAGSLGSDTGGSVRQPAAFTGTVGIKPTYGRCSRYGMIAYASSLDQAGVFARNTRDAALLLGVVCGHDPRDSTSLNVPVPDYETEMEGGVSGLRIGLPREYVADGMSADAGALWRQAAAWLEAAGASVREVSLPHTKYALPAYYIIAPAEASSNLARYDGVRYGRRASASGEESIEEFYGRTRAEGFGDEVMRRILMGCHVLSTGYYEAYYGKAQKVRALVARDFDEAFEQVDVLLAPTTPAPAFVLGEKRRNVLELYLEDVFTVPVNLAGLPALSLPVGLSAEGLPLGAQLIGRHCDEVSILRAALALEEAAGFAQAPHPWWREEREAA